MLAPIRLASCLLLAFASAVAGPRDSDAVREARAALDAAEAERESLPLHEAAALERLALALTGQGRREEAEPLLRRALSIREKVQGPKHADVATTVTHLASNLRFQKREKEAEDEYLRAIALTEDWFGGEHRRVASLLTDLGSMRLFARRFEEALADFERAHAILEAKGEPMDDALRLRAGERVGSALNRLGRHDEAIVWLRAWLERHSESLGEHVALDTGIDELARAHRELGQFPEADALVQRNLAIVATEYGEDSEEMLNALRRYAMEATAYQRGELEETLRRRVLSLTESLHGPDSEAWVRAAAYLGRVLLAQERADEAEPLVFGAAVIVDRFLAQEDPLRTELLVYQGRMHSLRGRHDEAVATLERAVKAVRAMPVPDEHFAQWVNNSLEEMKFERRTARIGPQPLPERFAREGIVYNSQPFMPERFDMEVTRVDRAHVEYAGQRVALWNLADIARDAGAASLLVRGMGDEDLCGGVLLIEHGLLVFFEYEDGKIEGMRFTFTEPDTVRSLWENCRVRLAPDSG
jgi:tetratricopeptide (TPR) repeat protein